MKKLMMISLLALSLTTCNKDEPVVVSAPVVYSVEGEWNIDSVICEEFDLFNTNTKYTNGGWIFNGDGTLQAHDFYFGRQQGYWNRQKDSLHVSLGIFDMGTEILSLDDEHMVLEQLDGELTPLPTGIRRTLYFTRP